MRTRTALLLLLASLSAPALVQAANHSVTVATGTGFSPTNITIAAGDQVTWTRVDGSHSVTFDDGQYGSPVGNGWGTYFRTFNTPGTYEYYCQVHSTANGTAENGVVNVTGGGGSTPGTLQFSTASTSVSEGAGTKTLIVTRTGGDDGVVSAAVNTANGSATSGTDYQTISNGTVTWGNGDSANKTIVIPIVGDTAEEPNENFTVTLSAPTGGASIGGIPTATVTINDDDNVSCEPCVANATTLCLAGGSGDPNRFRVRVTWTDFAGNSGPGKAVPFTPDAGFFYFFNNPNNLELLVKMVNGCSTSFDAYWFFYAAASNVGLEYEVVDTDRCVTKHYSNPLGNFASNGDINALATCP